MAQRAVSCGPSRNGWPHNAGNKQLADRYAGYQNTRLESLFLWARDRRPAGSESRPSVLQINGSNPPVGSLRLMVCAPTPAMQREVLGLRAGLSEASAGMAVASGPRDTITSVAYIAAPAGHRVARPRYQFPHNAIKGKAATPPPGSDAFPTWSRRCAAASPPPAQRRVTVRKLRPRHAVRVSHETAMRLREVC